MCVSLACTGGGGDRLVNTTPAGHVPPMAAAAAVRRPSPATLFNPARNVMDTITPLTGKREREGEVKNKIKERER